MTDQTAPPQIALVWNQDQFGYKSATWIEADALDALDALVLALIPDLIVRIDHP